MNKTCRKRGKETTNAGLCKPVKGKVGTCKECHAKWLREWKDENRAHYSAVQQNANLKMKYGITVEDKQALYELQEGRCVVCGIYADRDGTHGLHIDHDHKTGKVRGLLCGRCNRALGLLDDDPKRIIKLANYVEQ